MDPDTRLCITKITSPITHALIVVPATLSKVNHQQGIFLERFFLYIVLVVAHWEHQRQNSRSSKGRLPRRKTLLLLFIFFNSELLPLSRFIILTECRAPGKPDSMIKGRIMIYDQHLLLLRKQAFCSAAEHPDRHDAVKTVST